MDYPAGESTHRMPTDAECKRDIKNSDDEGKFMRAVCEGDLKTVEALGTADSTRTIWTPRATTVGASKQRFAWADANGEQPMHWACNNGQLAVVQWLHAQGVALDVTDFRGKKPLLIACRFGYFELAKWLHAQGASLDVAENKGWTAMHMVAYSGNVEIGTWLHEQGVGLDGATANGWRPIHFAISYGNFKFAKWLHAKGADFDVRTNGRLDVGLPGMTPIGLAKMSARNDMVEWLKGLEVQAVEVLARVTGSEMYFHDPKDQPEVLYEPGPVPPDVRPDVAPAARDRADLPLATETIEQICARISADLAKEGKLPKPLSEIDTSMPPPPTTSSTTPLDVTDGVEDMRVE